MNIYSVPTNKLTFQSQVKISFLCGFMCFLFFGLFAVLVSIFAPNMLMINNETATGPADGLIALIIVLAFGAVASAVYSLVGTCILRILGIVLPIGTVTFRDNAEL